MVTSTANRLKDPETLGAYDKLFAAPLGKKERAREAKVRERYEQKTGTVFTATKETLLEIRRLRDQFTSDPRALERKGRKLRVPFSSALPRDMGQQLFLEFINIALAGTPEGDIPDDWQSSFTMLSEDYLQELQKELVDLAGPEVFDEAAAAYLRGEDPLDKGKDGGKDDVDMEEIEA